MKRKVLLSLFLITLFVSKAFSDPISWKFSIDDKGNGEIELVASASIQPGWHMYDVTIPEGGPNPTTLILDVVQGATKVGSFKAVNSKLHKAFDDLFGMEVGSYSNSATFVQRFKVTDKAKFKLEGDVRAQACNDETCTPPIPVSFKFAAKDLPATVTVAKEDSKTDVENSDDKNAETDTVSSTVDTTSTVQSSAVVPTDTDLWKPVISELKEYGAVGSTSDKSLIMIFILGLGGGFMALLTPCVWPMIPMTVSFFLKRNKKSKGKAIKDAITYGLSIVVIYVTLGLLVTLIFGASALNDLSTNAIFNIIFFALLVFFGISFLGAFEIVLPASWTNKMDSKADSTTGLLSMFFMAFTLALVSFSCTGPVIGWLLVEAATAGAIIAPTIGMLGFAIALAIPFTLFAIFPSLMENMPKSGGWLNSVKVVLGFLELALALKFLSVADLAYGWRLLDREVFLALWIVLFTLLGFYLLGKLKFAHDSDLKHISVTRLFLAIVSLSFAIYMVPGLWGAPLKAISAFAPPTTTQDFSLYDGGVHAKFNDYEEGMAYARKNNKPVLIDFSGHGCVNCRKMENSVWLDARVKSMLEKDYVLITLMVDEKQKLPEITEVTEENGKTTKLRTVGDKWSYLQRYKFGSNSQPFYIALDNEGKPIGPSYAYDEDINNYIKFLNIGLDNYKKEKVTP